MKKFEYFTAPLLVHSTKEILDTFGQDGWELVQVVQGPNPESLVAGSVNFHRDLTHVRPIHPDTLSFLCESVGFSQVEIRRLSPVPDDGLLPKTGDEKIDEVVDQLNGLLYGFQDYAVVATA